MTHDEFTSALDALTKEQAVALIDKLFVRREDAAIDAQSIRVEGDVIEYLVKRYLPSHWLLSSNAGRADLEREIEAVKESVK